MLTPTEVALAKFGVVLSKEYAAVAYDKFGAIAVLGTTGVDAIEYAPETAAAKLRNHYNQLAAAEVQAEEIEADIRRAGGVEAWLNNIPDSIDSPLKKRVRNLEKPKAVIMNFYGNHWAGRDRIPHGTPGRELIPDEAWRTDCDYALSPYWNGVVRCAVVADTDFSVHPLPEGAVIRVVEVVLSEPVEGEEELC